VKVACTVTYKTPGAKARSRAAWRLTRGKRTVARGTANVRRDHVALDTGRLRGVRPGRYTLTLTVTGPDGPVAVLAQSVRIR
jgi:hypothetical protein